MASHTTTLPVSHRPSRRAAAVVLLGLLGASLAAGGPTRATVLSENVVSENVLSENVLSENVLSENVLSENVSRRRAVVVEPLANGSLERPRLRSVPERYRPSGARWTFVGTSGIADRGSTMLRDVPAPPAGRQAGFIQNSGAIQLTVSAAPDDIVRFRATQRLWSRTGPQRIEVFVDSRLVGVVQPAERSWSTHSVALRKPTRGVVTLELRGVYSGEGEDRTAFVDDLELVRRPRPIPAAGLPAEERRVVIDPQSVPTTSGVIGQTAPGDTDRTINTPVQAFAEWNDVIYVGGKFSVVETRPDGPRVTQRFLAAFDRRTGAFISSFRPVLDGAVWDLATTSDGKLIVAGQFTSVGGVAQTRALAALDPVTGAVVRGWRANLGLTGSPTNDRPVARALDVEGDWIYVAGNFTRVGPVATATKVGRLARVSVEDGSVDRRFLPDLQDGASWDVDATPSAVWVAGRFRGVGFQGQRFERVAVAELRTTDGRPLPTQPFRPTSSEVSRQFSYSILVTGGQVWVAGSQHTVQVYRESDFTLLRTFINFPIGDGQALVEFEGVVYAGTHAGRLSRTYADVQQWTFLTGATRVDQSPWVNALDNATRTHLTGWATDVKVANTEGAWEMFVDSGGCLWAGGDFTAGSPVVDGRSYAQGFVRFCTRDSTAPATPAVARARRVDGGVRIAWTRVADTGRVRYEVFRNDRLVRPPITKRVLVDRAGRAGDRYVVRAVDAAGNRSATSAVVVAG
jgi:hypothetical protein